MELSDQHPVRQIIEGYLADWDKAYAEGNAHGIMGHHVPQADGQEEYNFRQWQKVMNWTDMTCQSTLREFEVEGLGAKATIEQHRCVTFLRPEPHYALLGRTLLNWLSRFVFVEHALVETIWIQTGEGWLCQSDREVSCRLRIRRRT